MSKSIALALPLCVALGAGVACAATPVQLEEANQLLAADNPAAALELLEANHDPETASTSELFLLGLSAKLTGNLQRAEGYFRLALERDPGAGPARLELAEVLFRQGRFGASREQLVTVQNSNPPPQVRANVDRYLQIVEQAAASGAQPAQPGQPPQAGQSPRQSNWSGFVAVGLSYDGNVNAGPDTDTVFLYGLPFTLSSDAQGTEDVAWSLRAGVGHQIQLGQNLLWQSSLNLSFQDYFAANAYDTLTFSARSGPMWRLGEDFLLSIPLTYSAQSYTDQGDWYSQTWGIAPRLQYTASDNLTFYLDASWSSKRFNENSDRDLTAWSLRPSLNYQPVENGTIAFGLQYGVEDSGISTYSNEVRGLFLGYEHVFEDIGLTARVTASYTATDFEGIQPAYTVARSDESRSISASLSYALPGYENVVLDGSVSYQDNDSNLEINTYDRTRVSFTVMRRF